MQIYVVGGAVRDTLLGLSPKDRDYVVVGARPEELLARGFTQVGADFPVFLHPETNEEYALARTERQSGKGYHGFVVYASPDVTLEEDLGRRDLTINAIAMGASGELVDPYHGQADLQHKVLRHCTEAFREDPLRLLRVARFLARFGSDWQVAPETRALLQDIVDSGDIDHLTPERVWKEFEKGLMERHPLLMLTLLHDLGVFARPPFREYPYAPNQVTHPALALLSLLGRGTVAARYALAFPRRWAAREAKESRLPASAREAATLVQHCLDFEAEGPYPTRAAVDRLLLLESLDALRQSVRFAMLLEALEAYRPELAEALARDTQRLQRLSTAKVIGDCRNGREIAERLRTARLALL